MLSDEFIIRIQKNSDFIEFRDYIFQKINELNSVEGLGDFDNEKAGEEAKIRLQTVSKLLGILDPILAFGEKKGVTAQQTMSAKKKHGL